MSYELSAVSPRGEDRSVVRTHDIRDESIFFTSITNPFNSSKVFLSRYYREILVMPLVSLSFPKLSSRPRMSPVAFR